MSNYLMNTLIKKLIPFTLLTSSFAAAPAFAEYHLFTAQTAAAIVAESAKPQASTSGLNLNMTKRKASTSLEQIQSFDENDPRINVALIVALPKKEDMNLHLGTLSVELPETPAKAHQLDAQPFFYVGIDHRW